MENICYICDNAAKLKPCILTKDILKSGSDHKTQKYYEDIIDSLLETYRIEDQPSGFIEKSGATEISV